MLVFCEECGTRYSFPPEEVEPDSGQFRCRACGFLMTSEMLAQVVHNKEGEAVSSSQSSTAEGSSATPVNDIKNSV